MSEAENHERNFKTFEELNAMADAGELTQASLQEELHKYQQAIAEEYATTSTKSENVEANTREFFKNNVQQAAAQIVHLAQNGETPNIRLKASEFIIKEAFAGARHDGDPIKDLLTELTQTQTKTEKHESVISPQQIIGE